MSPLQSVIAFTINMQRIEKTEIFKFDPECPVDELIKIGVLKAFTFHVNRSIETEFPIRQTTVVALQVLASIAPPPTPFSQPSQRAKSQRNHHFVAQIWNCISKTLQRGIDKVTEGVITGIWTTLILGQDSERPFVDLWEQHVELFGQLAKIYERARMEDLDEEKGCYSQGLAIEDGLRAIALDENEKVWVRHALEGLRLRQLVD